MQVKLPLGKPHMLLIVSRRVQVKAWCYYESRLLGAHHGLLSSYALETMVLYIINIYHRSVRTPFQVDGAVHERHNEIACLSSTMFSAVLHLVNIVPQAGSKMKQPDHASLNQQGTWCAI